MNILLIDDDTSVRTAVKRMLLADGHDVREATDGREAKRLLHERAAEIVLSDIYMPEVDGIELLMSLRQEFPAVHVVIMSGGGNMETQDLLETAKLLGAQATLSKPIMWPDLRAAIASCAG